MRVTHLITVLEAEDWEQARFGQLFIFCSYRAFSSSLIPENENQTPGDLALSALFLKLLSIDCQKSQRNGHFRAPNI